MTNAATDVFSWAIRIGAHREDGEVHLVNLQAVAHCAIHDHTRYAKLAAGRHHDGAHQRGCLISLAVNHQHIAGFGHGNSRVDHQVVARAHFDR